MAKTNTNDQGGSNLLFVNSIQKGFEVLNAFRGQSGALSLAEITKRTQLQKSAAQRFVHTLFSLGYLARDPRTKQYRLSPKMLEFSSIYYGSDPLIAISQSELVALRDKIGETVNLAVLDGRDIILVARLPGRDVPSFDIQVGTRLPAIHTASGQAMISLIPESEWPKFKIDPKTELDKVRLPITPRGTLSKIKKCRKTGYAVVEQLFSPLDLSIAVPIVDGKNTPIAALSVSLMNDTSDIETDTSDIVADLNRAALNISNAFRTVFA